MHGPTLSDAGLKSPPGWGAKANTDSPTPMGSGLGWKEGLWLEDPRPGSWALLGAVKGGFPEERAVRKNGQEPSRWGGDGSDPTEGTCESVSARTLSKRGELWAGGRTEAAGTLLRGPYLQSDLTGKRLLQGRWTVLLTFSLMLIPRPARQHPARLKTRRNLCSGKVSIISVPLGAITGHLLHACSSLLLLLSSCSVVFDSL